MEQGVSLKLPGFTGWRTVLRGLLYLLLAILFIGIGWHGHKWYQYLDNGKQRTVREKGFRFTSPLLDVELPEGFSVRHEPIPFKYKINNYVNFLKENGVVKDVSVYYRDLASGPWFGINENQEFDAASMMKVPVMIAWLKKAEKDSKVLQHVFKFDGRRDMTSSQITRPAETLLPGVGYTVEELLHYMLNYSDNNAATILFEKLSAAEINAVLDSMDVTNNPYEDSNHISAHGYSGFFRILYNASYLNREMSEMALRLLTLQDFPKGIAAGVPSEIPVAAKFGEHVSGLLGEEKQLHEFGIIYHPAGPYILGIMTTGGDFDRQVEVIRNISQMIYVEVGSSIVKGSPR